ncbi:MAG: NAD(P)/FAD-dependent oxidoreductase [Myxococcaceae bacterium]|nr:NAD(P)/FAD-dependent oxidoreductase [Myxococcaceae bacterium]
MTYDVCIVGSGPSGSVCAWYLAKAGKKVLVLEKRKFPRDKICGDAVCLNAQNHMAKMGVLQEIEAEKKGNWSMLGGLVAPSGRGFIGDSAAYSGKRLVIAIKRRDLDEKMAMAAKRAGAELKEHHTFNGASLDKVRGVWTIDVSAEGTPTKFEAKVLVAADGAHSHVLQTLGVHVPPPDGICSRAYVKAGTHNFQADGVAFYTTDLIPGYCAIFKEADGDVNFCTYIIPGGKAKNEDLREIHERLLREHPLISKAMGPNAEIAKMQGAPLRLGAHVKSYYDHMVVIGDAAGHIDPLTGEGIHTAMDGGWLAAEELITALEIGDLSEKRLKRYEDRWMKAFGHDFRFSAVMAKIYTRFPIFVEASARVMQKKGARILYEWGKIMTGVTPKTGFLRPAMFMPVLVEAARIMVDRTSAADVLMMINGAEKTWTGDAARPRAAA